MGIQTMDTAAMRSKSKNSKIAVKGSIGMKGSANGTNPPSGTHAKGKHADVKGANSGFKPGKIKV